MTVAESVSALVADMSSATDDAARREAFRGGFMRLRAVLDLHPAGATPSATFTAASATAREVSAQCLPLGIGLVMHLYPLCALRCVPLPWWSPAGRRRARLLRAIDRQGLILANAGSERRLGAPAPVWLTRSQDGLRISGHYEYVSLADVADLVLFTAPMTDHTLFCATSLHADSVEVGTSRFEGSMQLSDTRSLTFTRHRVPPESYLVVPGDAVLSCMSQYQRSWFHLLLGDSYLARIEQLQARWELSCSTEQIAAHNELRLLREYALRLLDEATSAQAIGALARVTSALKLRISWMAQATAEALRTRDPTAATELGFLKRQPTSDDRIVRGLLTTRAEDALARRRAWRHPQGSYAV
jgi:hypothetical protein